MAHHRRHGGHLRRRHRGAGHVGVARVAVEDRAAVARRVAARQRAGLEAREVAGERAEQPARAAAVGRLVGAVRGQRDLRPAAREGRSLVLHVRGRHVEALALGDVGPGAGGLQHVGRVALLVDRVVGGRRDKDDPVLVRVVDRLHDAVRGGVAAVGPEAHVDRVGAAVGRVDDRLRHREVAQVRALDDEAATVCPAGEADAVAAVRAGQRGDVGPMPRVVVARVVRLGVLVDRRADATGELGMAGVDAGVDHADHRAAAGRDVPGGGEVLAERPPFHRRPWRRAGRALLGGERRVARVRADRRATFDLNVRDGAVGSQPSREPAQRAAGRADGEQAQLREVRRGPARVGARHHRVGAGVRGVRGIVSTQRDEQPACEHAALRRRGGDTDDGAGDEECAFQYPSANFASTTARSDGARMTSETNSSICSVT